MKGSSQSAETENKSYPASSLSYSGKMVSRFGCEGNPRNTKSTRPSIIQASISA